MSLPSPLKVVAVGHSFVRRLNEYFDSTLDVNRNLGLDQDKYNVSCLGFGGLSLKQSKRLHSLDKVVEGSDLVVIDIGSNDLCEEYCCPRKFARDLYSYTMFLQEGLRVKTVVIC
ncbi:hypothetical protein ACF0H5_016000 [Mactra antiquata]